MLCTFWLMLTTRKYSIKRMIYTRKYASLLKGHTVWLENLEWKLSSAIFCSLPLFLFFYGNTMVRAMAIDYILLRCRMIVLMGVVTIFNSILVASVFAVMVVSKLSTL